MKILIAEDDDEQSFMLEKFLGGAGHEVTVTGGGSDAFTRFKSADFTVVITDWNMPGMNGPQLCTAIRALARTSYTFIILMTAMQEKAKLIEGLRAGADDFIRKPVDFDELVARLAVAERIQRLHTHVTQLEGILSICAECKKIRNDGGDWIGVEKYMTERTDLSFSHGLCPVCLQKTRDAWALSRAQKPTG